MTTTHSAHTATAGSCVTTTIVRRFCFAQFTQQLANILPTDRVEAAGRLVGQDQRWIGNQRSRDRHSLLFSAA